MTKTFKIAAKFKKEIILGPLFKVLEVIFDILIPFIVAFIIDVGLKNNDQNLTIGYSFLMIGLGIAGFLSTLVCQYFAAIASQKYGYYLRDAIYKKIFTAFKIDVEKIGKGYILNLINTDTSQASMMFALLIRMFIRWPLLVIGSIICALIINWKIGLVFLGAATIICLVTAFILFKSFKKYKDVTDQLDKLNTMSNDFISGTKVVRGFNKQDETISLFEKESDQFKSKCMKVERLNNLINPLSFAVINGALILILFLSIKSVQIGELKTGEVVALVNYLSQMLIAILMCVEFFTIVIKGYSSVKRINYFLNLEDRVDGTIDNLNDSLLSFKNVYFSYKDGNKALTNISFEIKRNSFIGIIGATGSGKSTLLNLINKLYVPTSGEICFGNTNINSISDEYLHNIISYVPQKPEIFKGTIGSNLFNENIEELQGYLELAHLNLDINHDVEELGQNLSGGQKQRLSIARGLAKGKELLILDDPFSALDYSTEKEIKKNILNLSKEEGFTTILVSQRISSIKDADLILVMDKGEIVATGTDAELLKTCDIYKEIFEIQNGEVSHE